jgi:hypothetical protein
MADFAYSTTVQDQVSNLIFGQTYSGLTAAQKLALDANWPTGWTSGSPLGGFAQMAYQQVGQIAQWWYQAGATVSPDVWQHWFVMRMAKITSLQYRPDRFKEFKDMDNDAMDTAIKSFAKQDASDSALNTTAATTNIKTIRYETMQAAINRAPPVFLSPSEIDSATLRCLRILWNQAEWLFRRREVVMSVNTSSAVSFTSGLGGSEVFDQFVSTRLAYTDTSGAGIHCTWANPDLFADMAVLYSSGTGRPTYFRFTKTAPTTIVWQFAPAPDTTYTMRALVTITGPGDPSTATDTAPFDLFPVPFHQIIRDWVLGECLNKRDGQARADGNALRARCQDELERLSIQFADAGNVTKDSGCVRDVYDDPLMYGSRSNQLGGGM